MARHLAFAFATFFVGASIGLVCIWIMLGFLPVIVPAVSGQAAVELYAVLVAVMALAFAIAIRARSIVVESWGKIRAGLPNTQETAKLVQAIDAFTVGNGLMLAFAAAVVPPYIGALILVSPWMGIVAMGAIVAAFKGAAGASGALSMLKSLPKSDAILPTLPKGITKPALMAVAAVFFLLVAVDRANDGLKAARAIHYDRLGIIESDIARIHQLGPAIAALYQNREFAERDLVASETLALSRGVGSAATVSTARIRSIEASIALIKATADAADTLARLDRERIDIAAKIRSLNSIAPALH